MTNYAKKPRDQTVNQPVKTVVSMILLLIAQMAAAGSSEDLEWACRDKGMAAAQMAERRNSGITLVGALADIETRTATGSIERRSFAKMANQLYGPLKAVDPLGVQKAYYAACMTKPVQ